jgi:hypothetical protein
MASQLERAKESTKRLRQRFTGTGARAERIGTAFLAGAALGELERREMVPAVILGLPSKPVIAGALMLLAANSGGTTQRLADNASAGVAGAYGYAATKAGTLVAGDDDASEDMSLGL